MPYKKLTVSYTVLLRLQEYGSAPLQSAPGRGQGLIQQMSVRSVQQFPLMN